MGFLVEPPFDGFASRISYIPKKYDLVFEVHELLILVSTCRINSIFYQLLNVLFYIIVNIFA